LRGHKKPELSSRSKNGATPASFTLAPAAYNLVRLPKFLAEIPPCQESPQKTKKSRFPAEMTLKKGFELHTARLKLHKTGLDTGGR
jgi:hypothetical protein